MKRKAKIETVRVRIQFHPHPSDEPRWCAIAIVTGNGSTRRAAIADLRHRSLKDIQEASR